MKHTKISGIVLLSMLTITALAAQAQQMKADIPFDFKVGEMRLSAGTFTVQRVIPGILRLRANDTGQVANLMTHSVETLKESDISKLVFHRYGDTYYLSQVWIAGATIGNELSPSSAEREAAKLDNHYTVAMISLK